MHPPRCPASRFSNADLAGTGCEAPECGMRTNPRTCAGGRDIIVEVPNLNAFGLDVGFHVFVQTMGIRARNGAFPDFESTVTVSQNGYRVQNTRNYIQQYRIRLWRPGVTDVVPGLPLTAADGKR